MKKFYVFKHDLKGYEAVKDGFSWPGFFFPVIWLSYRKVWLLSFVLLVVFIFTSSLVVNAHSAGTDAVRFVNIVDTLVHWGTALIIGFKGNQFVVENLIKKGYKSEGKTIANNKTEAILSFATPEE